MMEYEIRAFSPYYFNAENVISSNLHFEVSNMHSRNSCKNWLGILICSTWTITKHAQSYVSTVLWRVFIRYKYMCILKLMSYLLSLIVPPIEKILSRSWALFVLWSVERGLTIPWREATALESPKFAQCKSPCFIRTTVAVEPVNSVAGPYVRSSSST